MGNNYKKGKRMSMHTAAAANYLDYLAPFVEIKVRSHTNIHTPARAAPRFDFATIYLLIQPRRHYVI